MLQDRFVCQGINNLLFHTIYISMNQCEGTNYFNKAVKHKVHSTNFFVKQKLTGAQVTTMQTLFTLACQYC